MNKKKHKISTLIKPIYSIIIVLIIILFGSCSPKKPDLKMKEISLNEVKEIEKLKDFIIANYSNLLESGQNHTNCYDYHGDKCYFPANAHLLHKYLSEPKGLTHLDYLTNNKIITSNIYIRSDTTIRIEIKGEQFIRKNYDVYNDTIYRHEIVYNISGKNVYELDEIITIKSKQIKPNWTYFVTKQWVD